VDTIGKTLKEINGCQQDAIRQDKAYNPFDPNSKLSWDDISRVLKKAKKGEINPDYIFICTFLHEKQLTNEVQDYFEWRVCRNNFENALKGNNEFFRNFAKRIDKESKELVTQHNKIVVAAKKALKKYKPMSFQTEAIKHSQNYKVVFIQLPPGSGKTNIQREVALIYFEESDMVVYVAPTLDLLDQNFYKVALHLKAKGLDFETVMICSRRTFTTNQGTNAFLDDNEIVYGNVHNQEVIDTLLSNNKKLVGITYASYESLIRFSKQYELKFDRIADEALEIVPGKELYKEGKDADEEKSRWHSFADMSVINRSASFDAFEKLSKSDNGPGTNNLDVFGVKYSKTFPEMINGNHASSSTDDLYFRLDFEYPKNLATSTTLLNVDANIYYPIIQLTPSSSLQLNRNILEETGSINFAAIASMNPSASYSASVIGFPTIVNYPYQFEAIDRTVILEIPDVGSTRYSTNKVRFESQELVSDLSSKSRATKKAFDQSPVDSNRVGLFFSPTKELNIDIAKSLGGLNLDNYIGDPSDRYRSNYNRLDELRHYYFQRYDNRDIYQYINLIKVYEKSMFEDIKKMLPARVKATTGLLIEPHILERSKIQQKKPTGHEYQQDVTIHYQDTTILSGDNNQYDALVNADLSENVTAENNQYESLINVNLSENLIADSYQYDSLINNNDTTITNAESYQQEVTIDAGLQDATITTEINLGIETYGQTAYETIGFGIYAQDGNAIRTYFDKDSRRIKERIRVDLVKEEKQRIVTKFAVTASANGLGDPRGGYVSDIQTYYETKLNIQPYLGSKVINAGTGSIVEVTPVDGYLPTHYRNTSDLTRGLQNSFFRGSKNSAATTLDGTSPIETFVSNPNTLTVNRTGRNTSEPILEVE
jgi:hypothetical protein